MEHQRPVESRADVQVLDVLRVVGVDHCRRHADDKRKDHRGDASPPQSPGVPHCSEASSDECRDSDEQYLTCPKRHPRRVDA
jgi:hypothetical protein